jgi:uncharacterized protein
MQVILVKVKPNAAASRLEQLSDGTWLARVKAPPVDGKANDELVTLIARYFKRRKSQITVKTGASGRVKRVSIEEA